MAIHDIPELRDKTQVFDSREDAGQVLARMLEPLRDTNATILAIPPGGMVVAAVVAETLALPLDVVVVSKIPFPWNPEAGYGAVAFDGTVRVHKGLTSELGLREPDISAGTRHTQENVAQRVKLLRGKRKFPNLTGRTAILIDDGIASSMTMSTAVEAMRKTPAEKIVVAVPTGYEASLDALKEQVDDVYCPNVRGGWGFAVGDAYRHWGKVWDTDAEKIVSRFAA